MTHYTVLSYGSAMRSFRRFLNDLGVDEVERIDRDHIRDYIRMLREGRNLSHSTIENQLSTVSSFFEYLVYVHVIETNIALPVRKRYLRSYKSDGSGDAHERKLITTEQLKMLVDSILSPRDKAVVMLLAKTGIRREELVTIDLQDIDLQQLKIVLKPKHKRSNRKVFFDEECARVLQDWLAVRGRYARDGVPALFVTEAGGRLNQNGVYQVVTRHAALVGLHDASSDRLENHLTPHCLRHWFTTYLRRNDMPREMLQELRGDVRSEAVDVYIHLDEEELKRAYLRCIPRLGIR
jgi:integrase/recombinase XerD